MSDRERWMELVGGPLDGERLDVSACTPEEVTGGFALTSPGGAWPGGRSLYGPRPGVDDGRLYWAGDTP